MHKIFKTPCYASYGIGNGPQHEHHFEIHQDKNVFLIIDVKTTRSKHNESKWPKEHTLAQQISNRPDEMLMQTVIRHECFLRDVLTDEVIEYGTLNEAVCSVQQSILGWQEAAMEDHEHRVECMQNEMRKQI